MKVPQLDLRAQYEGLRDAVLSSVSELLGSQQFILGPAVSSFEAAMARYLGVRECVGVSSGSDALQVALAVLDIGPGDEVLLPAFTFFATAGAVVHRGALPVFVDVGDDFLMDPADARRALSPRCKAAIVVHLYGLQSPWAPWRELAAASGIKLVEDAAQSIGSKRPEGMGGSLGDAAAFSFFPSKNLGGAGDGGLVICREPALTARARAFRNHGERERYHHAEVGLNARLDALQAVILQAKLPFIAAWNAARRERARSYHALLGELERAERVKTPRLPDGEEHVFHQYTLRASGRDALLAHLKEREVGAAVYYPLPLHQQPCFRNLPGNTRRLPQTERLAGEVLSLPIYPELSEAQQAYVVECIAEFYRRR